MLLIQFALTAARNLGEMPTEPDPYVDQVDGQGQQQKAQGGIRRGGPAAHLAGTAIAGFDTKSSPITAAHLLRCHIQMDENEHLPNGTAFEAFGTFSGGENPTHSQFRRTLFAPANAGEGVLRTVALAPTTQGPRAALLAPNRTGNDGGYLLLIQVVLHIYSRKATVQQQMLDGNRQGHYTLPQVLDDLSGLITRLDEANSQGEAQVLEDHVSGGDAIETGGAIACPTPDPQTLFLSAPAIVRAEEKFFSYPSSSIMGTSGGPMDETEAIADPEIAPKNMHASTLT